MSALSELHAVAQTAQALGFEPNPRAVEGDNHPPKPDPFGAIEAHIRDLYEEAKHWLDGEPISSEAQAQAVTDLLDQVLDAEKVADEARKEENKPFDQGKAAVQAKYAPLIADTKSQKGLTVLAHDACIAALRPWRQEQERLKREAAEVARAEAEEKARAASEAMRAAADDLTGQERAHAALREAEKAQKTAKRTERAAGTGAGLRSYWSAMLVDPAAAARWVWENRKDQLVSFLTELGNAEARNGARSIPGFEIIEDRRPV